MKEPFQNTCALNANNPVRIRKKHRPKIISDGVLRKINVLY